MTEKTDDKRLARLKGIVLNLPEGPGCYQYMDADRHIIYVGKAKNLKRRVSSYFNKDQQSRKTRLLVSKIHDIQYIVVRTEEDALLLENNLIKRHQPRYNVLLKDDKTYPSIAVTNEYLPRIFSTRDRRRGGATFYGPYSHVGAMHGLLDLMRALYRPRPCRQPMTREGVEGGRYEVCLNYHIKKCGAPCTGLQSHADYMAGIEACREILRGNTAEVARLMREEMSRLSSELRFEEAGEIKRRYDLLQHFRTRSEVVSQTLHHIDVLYLETEGETAFVNYLHVKEGCINQAFTFELRRRMDETEAELLALAAVEMRERFGSRARELVVPLRADLPEEMVQQTIPQKGDKRKLLDLSRLNVKQYRFDRLKQAEKLNPEQKATRLMKEIQTELGLERLPMRVELFDNSNLSGEDAVAACVVFERLRPAKKEYRKYEIRTVDGPDDYASMREVVRRRYGRLRDEGAPLPDLVIADGGAGQMEAIRSVVEDELGLEIAIAGLAKDARHRTRELLFGFPPRHVGMKASGELFRLLTQMQDEVHRFAIAYHRQKRSRRQTASALDGVPGVGERLKTLLLNRFGSVKRIREASVEALCEALGPTRGRNLWTHLHSAEKAADKAHETDEKS